MEAARGRLKLQRVDVVAESTAPKAFFTFSLESRRDCEILRAREHMSFTREFTPSNS
jgi:hypothetical protein